MLYYQVAGLVLAVQNAGEKSKERMPEYMLPLAKEGEHCCDYRVNIHRLPVLPEVAGEERLIAGSMWKVADNCPKTIYRGLIGMEEEVGAILQLTDKGAEVFVLSPDGELCDLRDYFCMGFALEDFALRQKRMVIHGSCIEVDGKAVVFVAPSGTGKSTHTGLWQKYLPNVTYINDDTPVLRLDRPEAVYACGSPWSGKTDLNANRQAPLAAVVLLRRGAENKLMPISGMDAYARILGETRKLPFKDSIEYAVDLAAELMERVPVYDFTCDISEDAVKEALKALG